MALAGVFPVKAALTGAAFSLLLAVCVLSGCASPDSFGGSREAAGNWALARGFSSVTIVAGDFELAGFVRKSRLPSATLVVYIEGDGAAWPTPFHPPADPTPQKPVALALAAADPAASVVYLARPCQYLDAAALARCAPAYWIERRFAPEVVAAFDVALTRLKAESGASRLQLVGYSGGGVIAALLAQRRDDVERLITVAAPLALADWVALHGLSPLAGSLDPADTHSGGAATRDALHFVGDDDRVVPPALLDRYVGANGGRVERIAGYNHERYWSRDWAKLINRARNEEGRP
jgi:dienelactone hydrolase